jgi:hypothetical protein
MEVVNRTMPTKRRFMLFLVVLAVMLLIKYAVGQDRLGWTPASIHPVDDIAQDALSACLMGVVCGIVSGWWRVTRQRTASELVMLRIHN